MRQMRLVFPEAVPVLSLTDSFSIYIHIPFCRSKCSYCAFHSVPCDPDLEEKYISALIGEIAHHAKHDNRRVSSVYFGVGTPSVLKAEQLCRVLSAVKQNFNLADDAEITAEINPGDADEFFFNQLRKCGFNRLSFGIQSVDDAELTLIGRRHSSHDAYVAVNAAKSAGFTLAMIRESNLP